MISACSHVKPNGVVDGTEGGDTAEAEGPTARRASMLPCASEGNMSSTIKIKKRSEELEKS